MCLSLGGPDPALVYKYPTPNKPNLSPAWKFLVSDQVQKPLVDDPDLVVDIVGIPMQELIHDHPLKEPLPWTSASFGITFQTHIDISSHLHIF